MEFPYMIIEGKMAERSEFDMTDGCQPTWAFFYLKHGSFRLCFNGNETVVNEGEAVILPDFLHFTRSVLDPIVFVYIKFRPLEKCSYSLDLPFGKVDPIDKARFTSDVLSYEKLLDRDDSRSRSYREHLFFDILFQLYMERKPHAGDDFYKDENFENCRDRLVFSAVEYIRANIRTHLTLNDICRALGTNQSTLNFKFRRELNCSVGEFIISARMRRARRLLIGTNYPIGSIADRCGYENIYYFSRAFKKEVGLTPSEFRESLR